MLVGLEAMVSVTPSGWLIMSKQIPLATWLPLLLGAVAALLRVSLGAKVIELTRSELCTRWLSNGSQNSPSWHTG